MNETMLLFVLKKALQALSDRLLTLIVFGAFVGMAIYAMSVPDFHRDGITAFTGLLFVYTLKKERPHAQSVQAQDPESDDIAG